jgi:hypothetical protein
MSDIIIFFVDSDIPSAKRSIPAFDLYLLINSFCPLYDDAIAVLIISINFGICSKAFRYKGFDVK